MIEKIKAFFGRAVATIVTAVKAIRYNYLAVAAGAVLALFGSGWNPLVGFAGATIVGVYVVQLTDIEEFDLSAALAVMAGAGIGAVVGLLVRLVTGGL